MSADFGVFIYELRALGNRFAETSAGLEKSLGEIALSVAQVKVAAKTAFAEVDGAQRRFVRLLWLLVLELGVIAAALWLK